MILGHRTSLLRARPSLSRHNLYPPSATPSTKGFGTGPLNDKKPQTLDELGSPACKCESGKAYKKCCGPIHEDKVLAATAEQQLRARFSAFREGKADFIISTTHPEFYAFHYEGKSVDEAKASYVSDCNIGCTQYDYDEFKIAKTEPGSSDLESFVAYSYKSAKKEEAGEASISERDWKTTNEKGRFLKVDGKWLFADYQRFEFSMGSLLQNASSEPLKINSGRDWKLNKGSKASS